jgi:hypothetical protein
MFALYLSRHGMPTMRVCTRTDEVDRLGSGGRGSDERAPQKVLVDAQSSASRTARDRAPTSRLLDDLLARSLCDRARIDQEHLGLRAALAMRSFNGCRLTAAGSRDLRSADGRAPMTACPLRLWLPLPGARREPPQTAMRQTQNARAAKGTSLLSRQSARHGERD